MQTDGYKLSAPVMFHAGAMVGLRANSWFQVRAAGGMLATGDDSTPLGSYFDLALAMLPSKYLITEVGFDGLFIGTNRRIENRIFFLGAKVGLKGRIPVSDWLAVTIGADLLLGGSQPSQDSQAVPTVGYRVNLGIDFL